MNALQKTSLIFLTLITTSLPALSGEVKENCGRVQKVEALMTSTRFTLNSETSGEASTYGINYMDDARALVVAAFAQDLRVCVSAVEPAPAGQILQASIIRLAK